MRYPDELIEEVRARNDIVDVISGYVRLQKKGGNHMGLCPFHNEKTPSFSVSGQKQLFKCFGCGVGGNVITFLMKYDNLSFQEAVKVLADRAGIKLPEEDNSAAAKKERSKKETLLAINKEAAVFYYRALREEVGMAGMRYLTGRGLSEETLHRFGLGYADVKPSTLRDHLKDKGFDDNLIVEAGLATFDEKKGTRDKFWNRVMFPIQDVNGKVIGFGGRVMGEGKPKYLNSPETPVFDKSRNLYGLNIAKSARKGYLILCEGYMDVIAVHQAGFPVAVASLGTAFTAGQANLIKRYAEEVLLAYDSDQAGTTAALRAIGLLKEAGIRGRVLRLSPCKDPDEFLSKMGAEAFQERIGEAQNTFFFETEVMEKQYNMNNPEEKTAFYKAVAEKLCTFEIALERDNYINAFADRYGIPAQDMRDLVTQIAAKEGLVRQRTYPAPAASREKEKAQNTLKPQRILLSWLSEEPSIANSVTQFITQEDFKDPLYRTLFEKLTEAIERGEDVRGLAAGLINAYEDESEQEKAAGILNETLPELNSEQEKEKALRDIVYEVKRISIEDGGAKTFDAESVQKTLEGKRILEDLRKRAKLEIR